MYTRRCQRRVLKMFGAPWKFLQALAKVLGSCQSEGCAVWGERGFWPGPLELVFGAKPCRRITSFNIPLFPLECIQPCSYPQSQGSYRQNRRVCSYQDSLWSSLDAGWTPKSKYVDLWWPGYAIMRLVSRLFAKALCLQSKCISELIKLLILNNLNIIHKNSM